MKVIYGIGSFKKPIKNTVLVIGVFDGLHVGHQKLIRWAQRRAKEINGKVVIMTFSPHPIHVLRPEVQLPLIISLPYRLKLLESLDVTACLVVRFTKAFSRLSPLMFVKKYLVKRISPVEVFVGDDFRFGQDRGGTLSYFQELGRQFGFVVNGVTPILESNSDDHTKISSTHIRELITSGELNEAQKYLGRRVSLLGKVVKGDSRGKTLGFPTANIIPGNEVFPPLGVYAVHVQFKKYIFSGMANIGRRPSFHHKDPQINIEVHIFDFHQTLYDQEIIVEFIKKIREEKFFPSKETLVDRLKKDEIAARKILSSFRK